MKESYHVHVDATVLPDLLHARLLELGFTDTNFSGHPEGYRHFEPNQHLTWKAETCERFMAFWAKAELLLRMEPDYVGYLEGEFIRQRAVLGDRLEDTHVPIPFQINRRRLDVARREWFRQAELHLVLDKDRSSADLINELLAAGLYGAYVEKKGWTAIILTAQGHAHNVFLLFSRLMEWLPKRGGYAHASLKEEVAIAHQIFNLEFGVQDLPEIVDAIEWR